MQLRAFIRDVLPRGPIWSSAKSLAVLDSLADAFQTEVDFLQGLPEAIDPRTCSFAILQQWAEFYKVPPRCFPPITDEAELRIKVLDRIRGPYIGTPDGLQSAINSWFDLVEIRDQLRRPLLVPISFPGFSLIYAVNLEQQNFFVPMVPSFKVVGTNEVAVLEVWYSPLLDNGELIRCFLQEFDQARHRRRLITPVVRTRASLVALDDTASIIWDGCFLVCRMNLIQGVTLGSKLINERGHLRVGELVPGGIPAGILTIEIERQRPDTTFVKVFETTVLVV